MKKIFAFMALLTALPVLAQVSNPGIVIVPTAPSGSCPSGLPDQQVYSTGNLYSCQNGTWGQVGTGSGGGFPIVLGSTSIGANSTTTSLAGLTVNGVTLTVAQAATVFLNGTGAYSTPAGGGSETFTGDGVIYQVGPTSPSGGTLAPPLVAQAVNCFLAGPASGSAAAPTCRAPVNADFPSGLAPTFSAANLTNVNATSFAGIPNCAGFSPTNGQALTVITTSTPNPCVSAVTGGGSSGTVGAGTSGQMTWYAASGTAVAGNANVTTDSGGDVNMTGTLSVGNSGTPTLQSNTCQTITSLYTTYPAATYAPVVVAGTTKYYYAPVCDATTAGNCGSGSGGGTIGQTCYSNGTVWVGPATSGGAVSSVSNSDSTLSVTPTTGAVVASLNLGNSNTWTAKQLFPASTTSAAPINIGQGTAPTSPANGDTWITSGGMYARVAGATVGPFATGGGGVSSVTGTAPVASSGGTTPAISITGLAGGVLAGSGPAFTLTPTLGVPGTSTGTIELASSGIGAGGVVLTPATTSSVVTMTVPAATDTLADLAGTQTLSNKTFVAPALGTPASGVITSLTGTCTACTSNNSVEIGGITVTGTPSIGYVPTATSGTAATWQAAAGGGSGGGTSGWSGTPLTLATNPTQYAPPVGGGATSTTEATADVGFPAAATVSGLYVSLSATLGTGTTLAVTLRDGGVSEALTCTTASGGTSCSDTTHSFNIAKGDLVDFLVVATGTVTAGVPTIIINYAVGTSGVATVIQTNGTNNSNQLTLNHQTSTVNAVGLTVTPTNPSGGNETFEITGTYTGAAPPASWTSVAITSGTGTAVGTTVTQNQIKLYPIYLPNGIASLNGVGYEVTTADNTSNDYDIGAYGPGCLGGATSIPLMSHTGATAGTSLFSSTGVKKFPSTTTNSGAAGWYAIALTSNAATPAAVMGGLATLWWAPFAAGTASATASSGSVLPSTITCPATSYVDSSLLFVEFF